MNTIYRRQDNSVCDNDIVQGGSHTDYTRQQKQDYVESRIGSVERQWKDDKAYAELMLGKRGCGFHDILRTVNSNLGNQYDAWRSYYESLKNNPPDRKTLYQKFSQEFDDRDIPNSITQSWRRTA